MCGFAGYYSSKGHCLEKELTAMGRAIVHRGPDDSRIWMDSSSRLGMVHNRLAVLELSEAGAQPMVSRSGRYTLIFNGEIYNHELLREMYLPHTEWRGRSDTETLIALIEHLGIDAVPAKLTGMFAFVVWDQQTQKLYLVRDRFGEKPLYFGTNCEVSNGGDTFFFTSELSALLPSEKFNPVIDREALALYFRYLYVPAPYSIYQGIFKVPTASIVTVDTHTLSTSTHRYWCISEKTDANTSANHSIEDFSFAESVNKLDAKLIESVAGQLQADVPVGAFLSGGIDSSAVVSVMQEVSKTPVKTYCIGFTSAEHNEAPFARRIAKSLGTDHTEHLIDNNELAPLVTSLGDAFDEPFADSSQIPTYAVAQCARRDTTVCLSGDGGDELFGGYTRYGRAKKIHRIRSITGKVGKFLGSQLVNSGPFKLTLNGMAVASDDHSATGTNLNQLARLSQLLGHDTELQVYQDLTSYWRYPNSPSVANEGNWRYSLGKLENSLQGDIRYYQAIDINHYLVDDILTKVDRCAMSVSLETRIPLLDHNFSAFAWALPQHKYLNPGVNKPLLFDLACKRVPKELLNRPKSGFTVPLHEWLQGPLKEWVNEMLSREKLQQHGLLEQSLVNSVWLQSQKGNSSVAPLVWSIVMFQNWYETVHLSRQ